MRAGAAGGNARRGRRAHPRVRTRGRGDRVPPVPHPRRARSPRVDRSGGPAAGREPRRDACGSVCTPGCSTRRSTSCSRCGGASRSSASTGSRSGTTSTPPTRPATRTASKRSPRTPRSRRRPSASRAARSCTPPATAIPRCSRTRWPRSTRSRDGRIVLGLGGGWLQSEYDAYGLHYGIAGRTAAHARGVRPVRARPAHPGAHDVRRRVLPPARRAVRTEAGAGAPSRSGSAAAARRSRCASPRSTPTAGTCRSSRPTSGRTRPRVLDAHCERLGRDPAEITKSVNVGMAFTDEELRRQFGPMSKAVKPGVLSGSVAGDGRQGRRVRRRRRART